MATRKPFGGMTVSFGKCGCSMKEVFGTKAMPPSQMTKRLWVHVKKEHLMKK